MCVDGRTQCEVQGVCVELKWSERTGGWVCVRMQRGGEGEWLRGCRHVHRPNPVARELHTLSRAISVADKWMPHRGRALALCPTFDAARASYLIRPLRFSISLREFATHQFHLSSPYFFPDKSISLRCDWKVHFINGFARCIYFIRSSKKCNFLKETLFVYKMSRINLGRISQCGSEIAVNW